MYQSIEPSLDHAHARVRWASERLNSLRESLDTYWESPVGRDFAVTITGSGTRSDTSSALVPESVPILIGETIYHLRAALDYLVHELAILDSGNVQEGARFLIEDSPASWKKHRRHRLKGVRPEHRAEIKRLQPLRGVEWTRVLRDISNPDKHRTFTIVEPRVIVPMGGGAGEIISATANDGMKMDRAHRPLIVFSERNLPVIETLEVLQSQVRATIDRFKPCFDENCAH